MKVLLHFAIANDETMVTIVDALPFEGKKELRHLEDSVAGCSFVILPAKLHEFANLCILFTIGYVTQKLKLDS